MEGSNISFIRTLSQIEIDVRQPNEFMTANVTIIQTYKFWIILNINCLEQIINLFLLIFFKIK